MNLHEWQQVAIDLLKTSNMDNAGEITRTLLRKHLLPDDDFYKGYEKVRHFIRKYRPTAGVPIQNFVPKTVDYNLKTSDKVIKFGLISDTHIGSKYTQISALQDFYHECKKCNITDIYHCGDITDGYNMRAGHEYELYVHGAQDMIDNIVTYYPKFGGITTHFITGNHDASLFKQCGLDIGTEIARGRPDMNYLGRDTARVKFTSDITMELRHPWDGSSYAISHKIQKIIDGYVNKPTILAVGHYHKAELFMYKGVTAFQAGCFQAETPFEVGHNIYPVIGGWIIELHISDNGKLEKLIPTFIPVTQINTADFKQYY